MKNTEEGIAYIAIILKITHIYFITTYSRQQAVKLPCRELFYQSISEKNYFTAYFYFAAMNEVKHLRVFLKLLEANNGTYPMIEYIPHEETFQCPRRYAGHSHEQPTPMMKSLVINL